MFQRDRIKFKGRMFEVNYIKDENGVLRGVDFCPYSPAAGAETISYKKLSKVITDLLKQGVDNKTKLLVLLNRSVGLDSNALEFAKYVIRKRMPL